MVIATRVTYKLCGYELGAMQRRPNRNMVRGSGVRGCEVADYPCKAWKNFVTFFF